MNTPRLFVASLAVTTLALTACGFTDAEITASGPEGQSEVEVPLGDPGSGDELEASPTTQEPSEAPVSARDCTAAGLDDTADFGGLGGQASVTAQFLLDAAVRCDEQALVTVASEDDTQLTFGDLTPEQFFALPDHVGSDDLGHYEVVARLLAGTTGVPHPDLDLVVWPAVFVDDEADANWDELVSAGLYTAEQVEQLRSGDQGYLGWRLGIAGDGRFQFLVAGD